MKWNPEEHGGVTDIRIAAEHVWIPDINVFIAYVIYSSNLSDSIPSDTRCDRLCTTSPQVNNHYFGVLYVMGMVIGVHICMICERKVDIRLNRY